MWEKAVLIVPSTPVFVNIELSPYCNNRCQGCGNVFWDGVGNRSGLNPPIGLRQWELVLSKLQPHVTRLRFTGGEPTLHPEFEGILRLASEFDIAFSLFTNGRWREPKRLLESLGSFPQFQSMLVSLHGAGARSHEAFTGVRGSFRETVANVRLAVEAGLTVNTSTVVTKHNYSDIEQILDFVSAVGVSTATIARYVGKDVAGVKATPTQLRQAVAITDRKQRTGCRVQLSVCIPQCFVRSSAGGCVAGFASFTVDPWGNVRPCNHAPVDCGNLLQNSVSDVWYSESMVRWRNSVPVECKDCVAFSWCHGGCSAEAMIYGSTADPLMRGPIIEGDSSVQPCREITLNRTSFPVIRSLVRPESFGYLLIRGTQTAPVSRESRPILDACDGTINLETIREYFGQKGLDFVGHLVECGFIELLS